MNEILSPEKWAARQSGSPSGLYFASRRRLNNPTPTEIQRELAAAFPPTKRVPISRAEENEQTKFAIRIERARRHREEEIQRRIRENRTLAKTAKAEWLAFNGYATPAEVDAWNSKYGKIYISGAGELKPVQFIWMRPPPPTPEQIAKFAEDVRAGRIPVPGAPDDEPAPRPQLRGLFKHRKRK